jgi:hypothetical protein
MRTRFWSGGEYETGNASGREFHWPTVLFEMEVLSPARGSDAIYSVVSFSQRPAVAIIW